MLKKPQLQLDLEKEEDQLIYLYFIQSEINGKSISDLVKNLVLDKIESDEDLKSTLLDVLNKFNDNKNFNSYEYEQIALKLANLGS